MSGYVPIDLRRQVTARANGRCEYCRFPEYATFLGCQVDHVRPEKHGGETVFENLALACVFHNRFKGSDVASIAAETGEVVRLFDPRTDRWADHFRPLEASLKGVSSVGSVTVNLLRMNAEERLRERRLLLASGERWP